ncbi:MAG: dUTP diphosphatase [Candidatus Woesearchaeota archaeon]
MTNKIKIVKLDKNAALPEYALDCDVAFDVRANKTTTIQSMEQKEISTGISIEIPEGYVGLIRDRVGVVTKLGCHVIAGTLDHAYREELTVVIINIGMDEVTIEKDMRIAQMVLIPVQKFEIEEVKKLSETKRTGKKFGVTGLK